MRWLELGELFEIPKNLKMSDVQVQAVEMIFQIAELQTLVGRSYLASLGMCIFTKSMICFGLSHSSILWGNPFVSDQESFFKRSSIQVPKRSPEKRLQQSLEGSEVRGRG